MDTKNVIAAISLSAAVIILYGLFFAPPPKETNNINQEKTVLNSEAPKLDSNDKFIEISREEDVIYLKVLILLYFINFFIRYLKDNLIWKN